jgi:hypothetical protein
MTMLARWTMLVLWFRCIAVVSIQCDIRYSHVERSGLWLKLCGGLRRV